MSRDEETLSFAVAHGLHSPLITILQLCNPQLPPTIDEAQRLRIIASHATELFLVTDKIGDLVHMETWRNQRYALNIGELLEDTHEKIAGFATPFHRRVDLSVESDLPQILANSEAVQKALFILFGRCIRQARHETLRIIAHRQDGQVVVDFQDGDTMGQTPVVMEDHLLKHQDDLELSLDLFLCRSITSMDGGQMRITSTAECDEITWSLAWPIA